MFVSWWTGIVAVFLIGRISSENDTNMSEPENVVVEMVIKTDADRNDTTNPSSTTSQEKSDGFSCFQCVNCTNEKTFLSETCDEGVTMCYKLVKTVDNSKRLVDRGCSTSKAQCTVPDDALIHQMDSFECCTKANCNASNELRFSFLLLLGLFLV